NQRCTNCVAQFPAANSLHFQGGGCLIVTSPPQCSVARAQALRRVRPASTPGSTSSVHPRKVFQIGGAKGGASRISVASRPPGDSDASDAGHVVARVENK